MMRSLMLSGKLDLGTLNRNKTAVATLLTFCPPGPGERMKVKVTSVSSMV